MLDAWLHATRNTKMNDIRQLITDVTYPIAGAPSHVLFDWSTSSVSHVMKCEHQLPKGTSPQFESELARQLQLWHDGARRAAAAVEMPACHLRRCSRPGTIDCNNLANASWTPGTPSQPQTLPSWVFNDRRKASVYDLWLAVIEVIKLLRSTLLELLPVRVACDVLLDAPYLYLYALQRVSY
jgi:hypothetical protein